VNPLPLLGLGLLLGLRHALDPDHVVAVAAIGARTRRLLPATWLGIAWGVGHTVTLFAVGATIILFKLVVPSRLGLSFELAVALALVAIGLSNLRPAAAEAARAPAPLPALRAFVVGLVHGLAGGAAVAPLVLAAGRDPWWGGGYLVVFGVRPPVGVASVTTRDAPPPAPPGGPPSRRCGRRAPPPPPRSRSWSRRSSRRAWCGR